MNTCGACKHAKVIPNDLRMRVCMWGPPQLVAMPHPQGVQIVAMRPNMGVDQEAPDGCFERAIIVENKP